MLYSLAQRVKAWRNRNMPRAIILMYHRVAEVTPDPWSLAVAPDKFAAQLDVLARNFTVLPLQELMERQRRGSVPDKAVAITFDDGYADNYYNALPRLAARELPATFFVSTGYVGQNREFWWDELARYLLEPEELPPSLALTINGVRLVWHIDAKRRNGAPPSLVTGTTARVIAPGSRAVLYEDIWRRLYALPHHVRLQLLNQLGRWLEVEPDARESHRIMSPEELCEFAESRWVGIGGHTLTHPSLSSHSLAVQRGEIEQNKLELERLLKRPVRTFSYPHGDYQRGTVNLLRAGGFLGACAVDSEPVTPRSNPFLLPRYPVENWSGEEFAMRLAGWLDAHP